MAYKRITPASKYLEMVQKPSYGDEDIMDAFRAGMKYKMNNSVWQTVQKSPAVKPNVSVVVLVDSEVGPELHTVLTTEFAEFAEEHDCLAWTTIGCIIPDRYK